MEVDGFFKEYWPILVGVLLVGILAFLLWPEPETVTGEPSYGMLAPGPGSVELDEETERDEGDEDRRARPRTDPGTTEDESAANRADSRYELLEVVRAVETQSGGPEVKRFDTDDPEVKKALSRVQVTLYQQDGCQFCDKARDYLSANGISYQSRDVDNPNMKEEARRLSGGTGVPVIVVDGQVLRGFWENALQAALRDAVKRRVMKDG